jgi:hypothetical protein
VGIVQPVSRLGAKGPVYYSLVRASPRCLDTRVDSVWFQRLKLKYDSRPQSFYFNFNDRPFIKLGDTMDFAGPKGRIEYRGRGEFAIKKLKSQVGPGRSSSSYLLSPAPLTSSAPSSSYLLLLLLLLPAPLTSSSSLLLLPPHLTCSSHLILVPPPLLSSSCLLLFTSSSRLLLLPPPLTSSFKIQTQTRTLWGLPMRKHIGCEGGYTWLHDCGCMGITIILNSRSRQHMF